MKNKHLSQDNKKSKVFLRLFFFEKTESKFWSFWRTLEV
jgi:hypothetical protein